MCLRGTFTPTWRRDTRTVLNNITMPEYILEPSNRDTANRRPVLRSVTVEERAFALRWLTQRFSCCVRRQCTHTFGEAADTASRYAAPARNWPM